MEPTASHPAVPAREPDAVALAALLDCEADLDALERALLAAAVHPASGSSVRAWLARWDERRGWLEGWRARERGEENAPLASAIARARRAPPDEGAEAERVRAWVAAIESLEGAVARAWSGGGPATGPGAEQPGAPWAEEEWIGVAPLRRGARPYGVIVVALPAGTQDASLASLALAADAALTAQSRAAEARRRARHLAAVAEFARAAVSASNVAEGVHALVRLAAQAVGAPHAALYRVRADGELTLELAHGPSGVRDPQARALMPAAAEAGRAARVLSGIGAERLPGAGHEGLSELSAWALVPVSAYGVGAGVLAVWDGAERHPGSPDWERGDVETLAALADHGALLFEHARRLDELAAAERRREDLASRLREQDRLAAVGELAARVAEDARQPLASVAAFVTRVLREQIGRASWRGRG